ncbi:ABC transporter substrate-binding protein [Hahella sp. CCB-MM4]|uniref:ABC transporter substrate-binding protein n=1 Tax=Hahella sp. (strain CCB-MM4) TaxID=1926491 RepID=UPI000B9B2EE4|nr:extracellular solute-binding protein [Hahella sp. CCB-MM4]OZG73603.1 ABC transporter substrate-binding protein [Hahella sp. CCB-MM4]
MRARLLIAFTLTLTVSFAWGKSAEEWINDEFTISTLSKKEQLEELEWFRRAAEPFKGMEIYVVSEPIDTHRYEANVLAKAFEDITGIKVSHEITSEDDVVRKLLSQIETSLNIYDAFISDSDLIGAHVRSGAIYPITDYIRGEGKEVTLPSLDLNDFIGLPFTTGPDGKVYQLPDQQFPSVYWYRHDWFTRPDFQERFRKLYGYELGVPLNWTAYEDIAEFFTVHVREIDGERVWGHMDYALNSPALGWRISDAWLSMAGMGDVGLPNGKPVDDWGIRVSGCRPVGASIERGGALDSPAAIYAIKKFVDWLRFAPPEARQLTDAAMGRWAASGKIAQQIFWYTAYIAQVTDPELPIVNEDGTPKWRIAPSPLGAYWDSGMKSGYQDAGSWTLTKNTPVDRRKAAWLYAQFTVSKTVSLKKTMVGLTPIRLSDINSTEMTERAPYLGGFVEFYRSRARNYWTPTGTNVPNYAKLSPLWWKHISLAVEGKQSVEQVMSNLAQSMDREMAVIAQEEPGPCSPKLNNKADKGFWISLPGAPKPKRNENPPGRTMSYEQAIKAWQ